MCIFIVIFRRAHKVWLLYVGEKKEEEAQKVCPRSPKRRSVFWCAKTEKAHTPSNLSFSFHLSFRQLLCVRLSLRTGLFFSLFSPVRTRNSSFLKHRIHPKHGSGRTSSLTRSNTRKCISSSFYFVFFSLSSSSLNNAQNSRCCFFSLCSCKEKEKSNAWALISVRGRNAPPCFV